MVSSSFADDVYLDCAVVVGCGLQAENVFSRLRCWCVEVDSVNVAQGLLVGNSSASSLRYLMYTPARKQLETSRFRVPTFSLLSNVQYTKRCLLIMR